MSSNLDLLRSIFAAWERGDWSSTAWAHPEIEYVIADGPEPKRWTGVAGMAEGWRSFASAWEGFRVQAVEYQELDRERVLVFSDWIGRGKTSGLEIAHMSAKSVTLFHIADDLVTRVVAWWDRDRALADLGLAPEGDYQ
jgi:ketosteroid isomerase-like protein